MVVFQTISGDHFARNHGAPIHQEIFKQFEFASCEFKRGAAARRDVPPGVHGEIGKLKHRRGLWISPSMQCSQSSEKLGKGERFGQIIVGAGIQATDAILNRALRCKDQYWKLETISADLPQDLKTTNTRQHHVEEDQVDGITVEMPEACFAGVSEGDLIPISLQTRTNSLGKFPFIFNDQYPHPIGSETARSGHCH